MKISNRPTLKIDGVYDIDTFSYLTRLSLRFFGFDFRPRSFNFLQQHKFMEIMSENFNPLNLHFLRFENEKDFVIKKMMLDLENLMKEKNETGFFRKSFLLEFSDTNSVDFYDQFLHPYWIVIQEETDIEKFLSSSIYLKGLVFQDNFINNLMKKKKWADYMKKVKELYQERHKKWPDKDLYFATSTTWGHHFVPSFFRYIPLLFLSYPISSHVEKQYRLVDHKKMSQEIKMIENQMLSL